MAETQILDRPVFEWNQIMLHPEMTPWYVSLCLDELIRQVGEWVIKFNSLSWTADREVHVVQISCVIIAYT